MPENERSHSIECWWDPLRARWVCVAPALGVLAVNAPAPCRASALRYESGPLLRAA